MLYGYTRVSSADQIGNSSLKEQENKIRGIALMKGMTDPYGLVVFSDPGVSGAMPLENRPAGKDLLASLQAGDTVIAAKLDRLFRSTRDALAMVEALKQRSVNLIIADFGADPIGESPVGQLIFTVLSACAQFERERIAERTSEGRRYKKSRGGALGNAPFGFRKEGVGDASMLVPCEREQEIMREVASASAYFPIWSAANFERKDAKDKSGFVLRALVAKGLKDRKGADFRKHLVQRLIERANG